MIGVQCREHEKTAAEEFFQLFKTPWEHAREGRIYEVLIISDPEAEGRVSRLRILFGPRQTRTDILSGLTVGPPSAASVMEYGFPGLPDSGHAVPILTGIAGCTAGPDRPGARVLARKAGTDVPTGVSIETDDGETIRFGFDLFAEVEAILLGGLPPEHSMIPALDIHISMLRRILLDHGIAFLEIPPVPSGYPFAACLTHDVDFVRIREHVLTKSIFGFLYRATWGTAVRLARRDLNLKQALRNWFSVLSLPLVLAGLMRDFWMQFDRYLRIEEELPSTFFFLPFPGYPGLSDRGTAPAARASRYRIESLRDVLRKLREAGKEIAVHGIDGWIDAARGMRERRRIAETAQTLPSGVRMHWLLFGENSFAELDRSYSYDSTFGYNDTVGFRAGTTQAYVPPGVENLIEIPMNVQDTSLFYPRRMNLTAGEAGILWRRILSRYIGGGGVLTVSWHQRSLGPERAWDGFYRMILADLREAGAWFGTMETAARWFRKRRSVRFEAAEGSGGEQNYRVRNIGDDDLPTLSLRTWYPGSGGEAFPQAQPVDVPLHEEGTCSVGPARQSALRSAEPDGQEHVK